jgi:hypothetical protein
MAIALVANCTQTTQGFSSTTTNSCDSTGATLLVVVVASIGTPTVSDSKSNTWTSLTNYSSGSAVRIFYSINPVVGSGHTFTAASSNSFPNVMALAFSGTDTTSPFDAQNGGSTSGGTSQATGSVTPAENNEVLVSGAAAGSTGTLSVDSSFTITNAPAPSVGVVWGSAAYLIQTSAGAVNATWSKSGSTTMGAAIATFKQAAAAATAHNLGTLGVGG